MTEPARLDRRALNRALLARQHLIERAELTVPAMLTQLVGMQAQAPAPPYVGLWTRLSGFVTDDLSRLILEHTVARIALMRSTLHLVTADDALALRAVLQPVQERGFNSTFRRMLGGADPIAIAARGRSLCSEQPRTYAELKGLLVQEFPDSHPQALAMVVRTYVPLVGVPPRGLWGVSGPAAHMPAADWFGRPEPTAGDPAAMSGETLALRYLGAFGPASVADLATWSGLAGVRTVLDGLRDQLTVVSDEGGRELYDLPDAPRPPGDVPVPVRLLPEWDSVLLGHADRSRIIDDAVKPAVYTVNGVLPGTVLVDGFVKATYKTVRTRRTATLTVTQRLPLTARDRRAIDTEAAALLAWAEPELVGAVEIREPG